jgi:hypothetical protein
MVAKRAYTLDQRHEAVTAYVVLGSFKKASDMTGIPWQTIAAWKHVDPEWWERTEAEVIEQIESDRRAGKRRVLGKALDVIEQRLEKGNPVLTKEGKIVRVPVGLKDAVVAFGVISDKARAAELKNVPLDSEARRTRFLETVRAIRDEPDKAH